MKSPLDFFIKNKEEPKKHMRNCDYPGCINCGEYKAPKSRNDLNDYYWFCNKHIEAYNKSWNYYEGMNEIEVELDRRNSIIGNRPTWSQTARNLNQDELLKRVFNAFGADDDSPHQRGMTKNAPELKALLDLGLQPPVTFKEIKKRYRKLVKQYHPDVASNDSQDEEKIKKINVAYQLLKKTYE